MKPADLGELNDPALGRRLDCTMIGSILTEGQMGSRPVVVSQVRAEDAPQVLFVENDHVVETLPPDGVDDAFRVSISPTGRLLARTREGLHSVNADGSNPILIVPRDENPPGGYDLDYGSAAWSPDGQTIASTSFTRRWSDQHYRTDVTLVDADGQAPRIIASVDWAYPAPGGIVTPSLCWSPDGSRLAFSAVPATHVFVVRPDGTGFVPVTSEERRRDLSVSWSR